MTGSPDSERDAAWRAALRNARLRTIIGGPPGIASRERSLQPARHTCSRRPRHDGARRSGALAGARLAGVSPGQPGAVCRRLFDLLAAVLRAAADAAAGARLRPLPRADEPGAVGHDHAAGLRHPVRGAAVGVDPPQDTDGRFAGAVLGADAGGGRAARLAGVAGHARGAWHRAGRCAGSGDGLSGRRGASAGPGHGDGPVRGRHRLWRHGRARADRHGGRPRRLALRHGLHRGTVPAGGAGLCLAAAAVAPLRAAPGRGARRSLRYARRAPARARPARPVRP